MIRALPPWRTLLPAEHGTWFMLAFPLLLGLLLRPTLAGLLLALAALAVFLARPALRRVATGQRDPLQRRALLLFGLLALALGGGALALAGSRFLLPLVLASPLAVLALRADFSRAVRSLPVELTAQAAFGALAPAILLAGGAPPAQAASAWLLASLVGGANLAHVRRYLGHAHRLDAAELRRRWVPVHVLHLLLLGISAWLVGPRGLAGGLWTGWVGLLYLRALLPYRPIQARILGWREGVLSLGGLLLLWRALL
jgi:hypothetical protein